MRDQATPGSGVLYRSPADGIHGPEDYPDAPINIVCERHTPGAGLFGVMVAIGGDIPLHFHSMMEFQFVLSGSGLALDADGGETLIAPGGTVLSPAGPAGAHGFRNTGPLPLTLLCIYPSPGGATPDRSPFEVGTVPGDGPRSVYVGPADVRAATPSSPGDAVRAGRIIDERIAGAELFSELLSVPGELPPHEHASHELLFITSGSGMATTAEGHEIELEPGGTLSCPAGASGRHGLRNTGSMPLQLLSIFPSSDGTYPG
jgi:quercetin dioxygenase-like cupin family protein